VSSPDPFPGGEGDPSPHLDHPLSAPAASRFWLRQCDNVTVFLRFTENWRAVFRQQGR